MAVIKSIFTGVESQDKILIKSCMRWRHAGASNMAVLEIPLLTGLSPELESLEKTISDREGNIKRFEVNGNRVVFYFDEISKVCKTCVTFKAIIEYNAGRVKSQAATVYDYYEPCK